MSDSQLSRLQAALLSAEQATELEIRGAVSAAVLVPLYVRDGTVHAVFTERHHELARHAGEISFPGGRRDPEDQSLLATALRETREEIGLAPEVVRIAGALQPTATVATGYSIYPFVGLIPPDISWQLSTGEVSEVIELPLPDVAAGYGRRRLTRHGVHLRTDTYVVDGHVIWGATARILADLLDRLEAGISAKRLHGRR